MKEPFVDIDRIIEQTKLLSDVELQSYLANLGNSQKGEFISSNVTDTIKNVNDQKQAKFNDLMDQVTGSDNNVTSAAYYIYRTKDLKDLANEVDNMTAKQINVAEINKSVASRQYEINEWGNHNKLDTLYFLQILFISLSFIGILIFMMSYGYINSSLFTMLSYLITMIAVVLLILRWRYSRYSRDGRYWHKLNFGKLQGTNTATTCGETPKLIPQLPPPKKKCP